MNIKKIVLRTVPYVCIALYGTKIGQAWRLAAGTAFAEKFLHWGDGFMQALASPLPSFYPQDVLAGMAIAMAFYAAVYVKGKNAKKFRHNVEYGSARWGTAKDIEPYVDPAVCQQHHSDADRAADHEQPPQRPSNGAKQKRAGGRRLGQRQDEILRQAKSHAMCVGTIPLLIRCDRPERQPDRRVRQDAAALRLPHQGDEHDQLCQVHALQPAGVYPQRKGYPETGKLPDCQYQRRGQGRRSISGRKAEVLLYTALIGYLWYEALRRKIATLRR